MSKGCLLAVVILSICKGELTQNLETLPYLTGEERRDARQNGYQQATKEHNLFHQGF